MWAQLGLPKFSCSWIFSQVLTNARAATEGSTDTLLRNQYFAPDFPDRFVRHKCLWHCCGLALCLVRRNVLTNRLCLWRTAGRRPCMCRSSLKFWYTWLQETLGVLGVVDHTRNILSFMKKTSSHGQVKNRACIFICEFVSNANRANFLTKLGFHKTCDHCNFCVRTDLRKAQQNTWNYGKVSTRSKAHSNGKQEV